jgi:hypothetical protein
VRSIRSFLNVDTPALAKIWHQHHQAFRSKSDCTVASWDQAVLAKPYFRSEQLLIAEDSTQGVVGFVHFGMNPHAKSFGKDSGIIHRLCVRPGEDEDAIAEDLLTESFRNLTSSSVGRCVGIGAFHDSIFYIGVAEGDGFLGVNANDPRLLRWMKNRGFLEVRSTQCWELSLAHFKPPMDRNQIAVHRNSLVSKLPCQFQSDWWKNIIYGHCDISSFQLVTKSKPTIELLLDVWTPEAFVPGVESWLSRITIPESVPDDMDQNLWIEHWVCLICECMRLLQNERKQAVQSVIDPISTHSVQILQRLGFKIKSQGMLMACDI